MAQPSKMKLQFWGVRGSIPTAGRDTFEFGGNTACVEIRVPDQDILIVDGGSGIRNLGIALHEEFQANPLSLHLFLTHFHWDHIQGLPFFQPLYNGANKVTFHSGRAPAESREILEGQMSTPYFPVNFELLTAKREFVRACPDVFRHGPLTVEAFPLNHPQTAVGYRFECNGAVVVHASDCEHGDEKLDSVLRRYAQNADVLIYDSQYTPEEYELKKGWGHSTWLEATEVAKDAGVKQLVLFHHDPSHSDRMIRENVDRARLRFENTIAAQEGWSIEL